MKARWLVAMLAVILCLGPVASVEAQERTQTGFYYPAGKSIWNHACGGWLSRDRFHGGCYFDGYYHIGEDMLAPVDAPVYAISAGTIAYMSLNGWGTGNVGVAVKHRLADGRDFIALYGHVRTWKRVGDSLSAGEFFARVGPYPYGSHLHFGVRPGTGMPASNWGMMPNRNWSNANGFVDPVSWIRANAPNGGNSLPRTAPNGAPIHPVTFSGIVLKGMSGSANVRSGPGLGYGVVTRISAGTRLTFAGWCTGDSVSDAWTGRPDNRWFVWWTGNQWAYLASGVVYGSP